MARIADTAHATGAAVFVDAYQAAGVMPLEVDALHCDYLVTGTGKYLLGLPRLAFLYVRNPDGPRPTLTGWLGRADPHAHRATVLDFPPHARRYETGTPAVAAVYAAVAGLSMEIVRLAADVDTQGPHLALVEPHAEAMAAWLGHRGVIAAPRTGVLRLATHAYTTTDDLDAVSEAVASHRCRTRPGGRIPLRSTQPRSAISASPARSSSRSGQTSSAGPGAGSSGRTKPLKGAKPLRGRITSTTTDHQSMT
ncbi:Aminotransferase class-V [Micromonospora saelicesensis]|uniref:Aminotransferase class-V n=1 Tax=Micromonospora saelicesensis TaxID=285676 RepID=A0A1C4Z2T3_9ACTN|nr:aminotransferase class V-fold PLP-dependent enzyme [Micromonospora saelicesensis]SCF27217.1 Aminotransferase class-V [Micromonospora saelicesensis]